MYFYIAMEIKDIQGNILIDTLVTQDAVKVDELMKQHNITLSWVAVSNEQLPLGTYIDYDGVRYSLLEPYSPEQVDEATYSYKPIFHHPVMRWQYLPFFHYTDSKKELDWSLTDNAANFMSAVIKAVNNETGESWSYEVSSALPASASLSFSNTDIFSALNSIAGAFETEWWFDYSAKVVYLSKASHGEAVILEVGRNVGIPSKTDSKDGYFTRFYAFGSTRNIEQNYAGSNVNSIVNKRLTLDPQKYPDGYIDIREGLTNSEILVKTLVFDDIYPRSSLTISDVRVRLMWRLDDDNKKVQIGTDAEGNPVYDQYAIWYFKIPDFTFRKDLLISGKALSVHFNSGPLSGRDFELTYHEKAKEIITSDGVDFYVEAGDYEINFVEEGTFIIPAITGLTPVDGNEVTLFNIVMPEEYKASAYAELEQAVLKEMAKQAEVQSNYTFDSNKVAFYTENPNLTIGSVVDFKNGNDSIKTRVIKLETKLDYLFEQKITVGNGQIKGTTQTLKEEVVSANQNIDLLAAINESTTALQQALQRTQKLMQENMAADLIERVNVGTEENPKYAIVPKQYKGEDVGIVSDTFITAGGVNSSASSGAFYNRLDRWDDYNETDGAVLSAVLGYVLKSDIEGLDTRVKYLEQNSGGSGNVNEAQLSAYLKKTEAEALYAPLALSTKVNSIQESLETHVLDFNNFKNVTYAKHLSAFNTFKSEVSRRLDELESFWVLDAETNSIKTTYNVLGALAITAGGVRDEGSTDGLYNRLDRWEDYDATSGDVLSAVLGYDLNTRIERLERNNGNVSEEQLEAYLKKNDAASMYVPIARFEDLNTKVSSFLEGTDDNNIIDKWRELESFLAGQTETSTLAELLAVKADRSALEQLITRVATAEGSITINKNNIATNLASINVLNGYFTSGSANNALQLGGQLPAYYATKAALDTVTGNLNTHIATYNTFVNSTFANFKADTQARLNALEGLWAIDDANDGLYPKNGRGIYSESYVTSGGVAGSVGNVIFTRLDDWDNYDATAGDVLSAKLGYELKQLIGSSSGSSADLSAYVKKAELTSELGNYVKTSTLTSTLSSYVLTTTLNTVLGNYVQTLALNSKLNGYQTLLSTSNKLPTSYISGLASVATSGSYNDLSNKPTIPSLAGYAKESWVTNQGYITRINKSMVVAALDYTPYDSSNPDNYITSEDLNGYATQSWVKARGYITGIDDGMISNALGYTPYDASNPNGYITGVTTSMVASALKGATISGALTVSGAFYAGSITHGSDMRYKSKLNDIAEDINVIADAPFFDFVWKGEDEREYIGTSAQYWLTTKFNNAVLHDKKKDFYSLAYGELGVGIGIINSRAIVSHEERIKVLEAENAALKTELNTLNRRIALWQH